LNFNVLKKHLLFILIRNMRIDNFLKKCWARSRLILILESSRCSLYPEFWIFTGLIDEEVRDQELTAA
jgi:hypothetical protein